MSEKIPIPIVIIAGPTGAGKSSLALTLARRYDAEIINLDAFQIYRGMRIGTAQPTDEEQRLVPHWLYNFYDPSLSMSAAAYTILADQTIAEVSGRGKRVILVGGAGFYMRSLLLGLFAAPAVDEELRASLAKRAEAPGGKEALHQELSKVDPESAARLPVNDVYRVSRALEVFYQTGKALSAHHKEQARQPRYPFLLIGINPPKEQLSVWQIARIRAMFAAGWEYEVRELLRSGLSVDSPGFRALGYRAVAALVSGQGKREEVIEEIQKEHQQYAKRQRTWLRGEPSARLFASSNDTELEGAARAFWGYAER